MADRAKIIEGMEQFRKDFFHYCGNKADWERFDAGLTLLKESPEIVRCRDCKKIGKCDVFEWNGSWPGDDWFCPDGKRRDDDG